MDGEREKFEEWAKTQLYDLEKLSMHGTYRSNATRGVWYAWQARASLPSAQPSDVVERPEFCVEMYKNPSGAFRNEELPEGFRVQNHIFAKEHAGKVVCTITARTFAEANYYAKLLISADKAALTTQQAQSVGVETNNAVLPYAVNVGGMSFGKGVKLQTLVDAAARWKKEAGQAMFQSPTDTQKLVEAAGYYVSRLDMLNKGYIVSDLEKAETNLRAALTPFTQNK